MEDCWAKDDANCEMGGPSVDQCRGQCLVVDEVNGGYCLDEQRRRYSCLASGGYVCANGYAQPNSTCVEQTQAVQECSRMIPCWTLCDQGDVGCSSDRDSCIQKCDQDFASLDELSICGAYYNQLVSCWGRQESLNCDGPRPSLEGCEAEVVQVGECIESRDETCDGFCWTAEALGCGDGCLAPCQARAADSQCGNDYERIIDCAIDRRALNMECDGDQPVATVDCVSDVREYEACLSQ